jgi:hypothetical protein
MTVTNVGTAAIVEGGDIILPAGPPYTYLGVAEGLMPGVAILAASNLLGALANVLLCAHLLECLLKTCLSHAGIEEKVLMGKELGHNLIGLWSLATSKGAPIPIVAPSWVARLSDLHNRPFHLRYSTNVHGVVLPATEPMVSNLNEWVAAVRAHVIIRA